MSATPLSVAIMNGHYKCVDALLRYSNIVNKTLDFPVLVSPKTSSNRMTPIMLACLYGQHSVVSVLLAYNANCILTDSSNSNLLHYTARAGVKAAGVFEVLRAGLEEQVLRSLVLYTDVRGYTALHHACLNNQLDIIPILISLGSDVNMRTAPLSDSICHVEGREESRSSSVRSSAGSILPPIPIQTSTDDISIGGDSAAKATEKRQTSETVSNRSINNSTGSGNMIRSISMSLFSSSSKDGKTDGKIEGVMKGLECSSSPADFPAEGVCVSQRSIVGSSPLPDADTVRHLSDGNSNDNINSGIGNSCSIGITPNDKKSTRSMKATAPSSSVVWGVTPLHIAVKKRSEVAVTLLLGENANPVIKDDSDVSPLDLAKKLRADSPILLILNKAASMLSEKSCSRSDVCLVPDDIEGTSFKSQPRGL